jgi:hypothetical protein
MDILDFSIDRRRSTWENRGYVSKTVLFEIKRNLPGLVFRRKT